MAHQKSITAIWEENAANPHPVPCRIVLRADSAFGTVEVFQRLLELGYDFSIKMFSGGNVNSKPLFDAIPIQEWIDVGKHRHASPNVSVPAPKLLGPYPLRLIALRRTDVDQREVRSVVATTLGFQECKGTINFGNPRLRKYEGNAAFTQLVLFAFNLLRWARTRMQTRRQNSPRPKRDPRCTHP